MSDHEKLREAIRFLRKDCGWTTKGRNSVEVVIAAAESTLPKTKMVELWRVEFARWDKLCTPQWSPEVRNYNTEREARDAAEKLEASASVHTRFDCIRVTGPHMQEVPA